MASTAATPIIVDRNKLPDVSLPMFDFKDSTFWRRGLCLPPPSIVRQAAAIFNQPSDLIDTDPERDEYIFGPKEAHMWRHRPVIFSSLNILVKWGGMVRPEEAVNLYTIRKYCPRIPVPEVHAWCVDGSEVFIYMEYVPGHTLESVFDEMTDDEHALVIQDLSNILADLRLLKQAESEASIGNSHFIFF